MFVRLRSWYSLQMAGQLALIPATAKSLWWIPNRFSGHVRYSCVQEERPPSPHFCSDAPRSMQPLVRLHDDLPVFHASLPKRPLLRCIVDCIEAEPHVKSIGPLEII